MLVILSFAHILLSTRFLGYENKETFFSNVQRSRIVYEILSTAIFGKKKKGEVGIERLVDEGVFSSAFPLHDVSRYFVCDIIPVNNLMKTLLQKKLLPENI